MSWLANGTSLNSLAYRGIGVDFSTLNMYSAEVSPFDMKLGKKDEYSWQDSERIQAVY